MNIGKIRNLNDSFDVVYCNMIYPFYPNNSQRSYSISKRAKRNHVEVYRQQKRVY